MLEERKTIRLDTQTVCFYEETAAKHNLDSAKLLRFVVLAGKEMISEVLEKKPDDMDLATAMLLKVQNIPLPKQVTRRAADKTPYKKMQLMYNKSIEGTDFVQSVELSTKTKRTLKKLHKGLKGDMDKVQEYYNFCVRKLKNQDWATGKTDFNFRADIEYMSREETYVKCRNGNL